MAKGYVSVTALSSAKNYITTGVPGATHTYRTYIKPREHGELRLVVECGNRVDSTWDDGAVARANLPGGLWRIESAWFADGGKEPDGAVASGSQVPVTWFRLFAKVTESLRIRFPS